MNLKEKIKIATSATKYALSVPLAGLMAHLFILGGSYTLAGKGGVKEDYSLKNRFETAYSFTTPDDHKFYNYDRESYASRYDAEIHQNCQILHERQRYMMWPYVVYPAMLGLGYLGARNAIKEIEEEKKKKQKLLSKQKQR